MSLLIRKEGDAFIVQPITREPGMHVSAPPRRVEKGGEGYGISYAELERHGEGEMFFPSDRPLSLVETARRVVINGSMTPQQSMEAYAVTAVDLGLEVWIKQYVRRFGDGINMGEYATEKSCIAAMRKALRTGIQIPEPPLDRDI